MITRVLGIMKFLITALVYPPIIEFYPSVLAFPITSIKPLTKGTLTATFSFDRDRHCPVINGLELITSLFIHILNQPAGQLASFPTLLDS